MIVSLFLVTGCGRSGTGWAARMFTELGHPCGHEEAFSPWHAGPLRRPDSSWLAVPHLAKLPEGTPIVRAMRDPYQVVQSIVTRGFLRGLDGAYEAYVMRHMPKVTEARDHLGRAIRWATLWDEPVTSYPHRLLRVDADDLDPAPLVSAVLYATGRRHAPGQIRRVLTDVGRKVNSGPGTPLPTREQINRHPEGWRIAERATLYGYGG